MLIKYKKIKLIRYKYKDQEVGQHKDIEEIVIIAQILKLKSKCGRIIWIDKVKNMLMSSSINCSRIGKD